MGGGGLKQQPVVSKGCTTGFFPATSPSPGTTTQIITGGIGGSGLGQQLLASVPSPPPSETEDCSMEGVSNTTTPNNTINHNKAGLSGRKSGHKEKIE